MAGQEWGTASLGGSLAQAYLTDWLRYSSQPLSRFRQFCDVKEAIGKGKGDTFNWDIIANVATQGTSLTETSTIPATNFTVTKGTLTVNEYGNSVPLTRKIKEMSQHDVKDIIRKSLANDMAKTMDQAVYDAIKLTPLIAVASAGTDTDAIQLFTNGTATGTVSVALSTKHVRRIVDTMKERNIPAFDGEDYICIAHPSTLTSLRTELQTVNQYTETGYKKVLNGEIGRFGGVRFVEQTNIAKEVLHWSAGCNWAYFVGGEAVIEAISVPDEIREKEVTDYGRSLGLAWYNIVGFGLCWTTAADARVVKWASL